MGREELQLLEAMEMYGFGNWEFVSKQIETRTPEGILYSDNEICCYLRNQTKYVLKDALGFEID